jgi:hypothetical protein
VTLQVEREAGLEEEEGGFVVVSNDCTFQCLEDVLTLDELVQFVRELVVLGDDKKKKREVKQPKRISLTPCMGQSSARSSISNSAGTTSGDHPHILSG